MRPQEHLPATLGTCVKHLIGCYLKPFRKLVGVDEHILLDCVDPMMHCLLLLNLDVVSNNVHWPLHIRGDQLPRDDILDEQFLHVGTLQGEAKSLSVFEYCFWCTMEQEIERHDECDGGILVGLDLRKGSQQLCSHQEFPVR